MGWRQGEWGRFLEMVQQLSQPSGVLQKKPSQHRLKSRGLPIGPGSAAAGPPTRLVAAAQNQPPLRLAEQRMETLQGFGLGFGLHGGHHRPVQVAGPGRLAAVAQPLVQFPDRIPQPGQLGGGQGGVRTLDAQRGQPLAWSVRRG